MIMEVLIPVMAQAGARADAGNQSISGFKPEGRAPCIDIEGSGLVFSAPGSSVSVTFSKGNPCVSHLCRTCELEHFTAIFVIMAALGCFYASLVFE